MTPRARTSSLRGPFTGEQPTPAGSALETRPAAPAAATLGESLRRLAGNRELALFTALILLHLLPIWSFPYVPTEDGAAHVYNADVIQEYHRPDAAIFRQYLAFNPRLVPNWFGHALMAALMFVVNPIVAQKLLLSLYVILFPLSVRFALRQLAPDSTRLAFLAFPLVFHFMFHKGFYNFCFSTAFFFVAVGTWLRHRGRFGLRQSFAFAAVTLLLYFAHIFSLLAAWVLIALLATALALADVRNRSARRVPGPDSTGRGAGVSEDCSRSFRSRLARRLLTPGLASMPALALVVIYLGSEGLPENSTLVYMTAGAGLTSPAPLFWESIRNFPLVVVSFGPASKWLSLALTVFILTCVIGLLTRKIVRREWRVWDAVAAFPLCCIGLYIIALATPELRVQAMPERLRLYAFFGLMLWFATNADLLGRWIGFLQWGGAALAGALLLVYTLDSAELDPYLREYVTVNRLLEPNSTLLPIPFTERVHDAEGQPLEGYVDIFLYAGGYLAADRRIVDLTNYEAAEDHFPLVWRPQTDPAPAIGRFRGTNWSGRPLRFLAYSRAGARTVDYVLLWQLLPEQRGSRHARAILDQLERGYDLIYSSPEHGFVQLYRRKDWTPRSVRQADEATVQGAERVQVLRGDVRRSERF